MIEAGRKDIAKPIIRKEPRLSRAGTPRYSLNWESYSDLPAVSPFNICFKIRKIEYSIADYYLD